MGHRWNRAKCGLLKSAEKMTNLNGWMAYVVACQCSTAGQSVENTEASIRDVRGSKFNILIFGM